MDQDYEKLIEQMINRIKANGDLSAYKKSHQISPFISLLSELNSFPKASVPQLNLERVRNQILDRIAIPEPQKSAFAWFSFLRIGAGIMAGLMIVVSLTFATAIAALTSVPGQAIYPLKQIVENIQLKLAPASEKTNLQITFANNRVDELQQVLQQQQDGQISNQAAQQIVASTVQDLQKTTAAATKSAGSQPKPGIATKLADLSNKLKIASIRSEGEVKIELEQAISSIAQTGVTAGDSAASTDNSVSAHGKLTGVSDTSVSIGTAKFLITTDTKYVNIKQADLALGQTVDIEGVITNDKTYVKTLTLITDVTPPASSTTGDNVQTPTPAPDTSTDTVPAPASQ